MITTTPKQTADAQKCLEALVGDLSPQDFMTEIVSHRGRPLLKITHLRTGVTRIVGIRPAPPVSSDYVWVDGESEELINSTVYPTSAVILLRNPVWWNHLMKEGEHGS